MSITTDGLIVDDLIKSISRMKVPFCEEDVTAWAVSHNADEKMLKDVKDLFDTLYMANYEKRKSVLSDMSGIDRKSVV